ncbi:MAG: YraN family protein [Candidatus Eisenbacteria bacterium]
MESVPGPPRAGALGEDVAALLLASRGYRILARNARFGRQEIDLVAERGRLLVAVEVKWRADEGALAEAWSPAQRRRCGEAVLAAMADERFAGAADRPWRFDLVTIAATPEGWTVQHRKGVWSPGNSWW